MGLRFTGELENSGLSISVKIGRTIQTNRSGPGDESIEAFVLTMRLFVQDNEDISLRNLARLYSELPIDPDLVSKFNEARLKTNADLDSKTFINLNGVDLTSRYIFYISLYGGLAHSHPEKKPVFDSWTQNQFLFPLLQNEFVRALGILLNMIFCTRAINKAALTQLALKS